MHDLSPAAEPNAAPTEPWTRREILQQPATLRATQALLDERRERIESFLSPLLAHAETRIVLAGAGTSAFIGESLAPWLSAQLGRCVEAVPTTDLVSAPDLYFQADRPTLLVSFGRSGNSPESIAAVELADASLGTVRHLVITCNPEGALASSAGGNAEVIVLPAATHDRGFAMTSSFTAMLYAALAVFTGLGAMAARNQAIVDAVGDMLERAEATVTALAQRDFDRVVYLGSGVFKGLAREAALKLLELTDGGMVTMFDSTMGFRHGPKTVVNDRTLVVVFVSNDPLTRRYDLDLIAELRRDGRSGALLAVSAQPIDRDALVVRGLAGAADVDLLFAYIVPAQLFALRASIERGLTPDQPNASGTVSRVVQGVRIHAIAA